MAYVRTKLIRLKIKELAKFCSFFTSETDWNAGCGCLAKERLINNGTGMCCDFICPLAYTADLNVMEEENPSLYKEWIEQCKKNGVNPVMLDDGWVVQYMEKG